MLHLTNYSEKAVKISGEGTKAHKEKLKELGGRYNKFLQGGAGWIFSRRKLPEIEAFLTFVNSATVNANYMEVSPAQPLPTLPGAEAIAKIEPATKQASSNPPNNKAKRTKVNTIGQQMARALKFTPDIKSSQKSIDVLNYAMFKNGRLHITDLTNFVNFAANIDGATDGILIPIEPLKKAKTVQMSEGNKVLIDGVKYPCNILEEGENFPEPPELVNLRSIGTFSGFGFLNPIFLGRDELRPAMMHFNYDASRREFCATDAHAMRVWKAESEGNALSESFTCKALLCNIDQQTQVFKANDGVILFEFDDWQVILKELDGRYMDYNCVIPDPENATAKIRFNAGMIDFFKAELPKLLAAANKDVPIFKIEYKANDYGNLQLTVSSENIDHETEYKKTTDFGATFRGKAGAIGFNVNLFNRCLKEIKENATFCITTSNRPATFVSESGVVLLMPVMIS